MGSQSIEEKKAKLLSKKKQNSSNKKNPAENMLTPGTYEEKENVTEIQDVKKVEFIEDKDLKKMNEADLTEDKVKSKNQGKKNINRNNIRRKVGRPKGVPSTKISLNVPDAYLELVNIAAGIGFRGNLSQYIISLMEKDIEENGSLYKKIARMNIK